MGKIIDSITEAYGHEKTTVSFEFFPAKTPAGVANLLGRVQNMALSLNPTFVTLTWRSAFEDEALWLNIGSTIQREFHVDVLLHLTCHLPVPSIKRILRSCREAGIRNILALRGDPAIGEGKWRPVPDGLNNAVDLVRLIREEHGNFFCIAVAGYPEVHTESWNHPNLPPSEQAVMLDLERLKMKQDAGADLIITQFFFDVDILLDWVRKCRTFGINIPIIPGYLPIQNYQSFQKFTSWCKTRVPTRILEELNRIKTDDAAVKEYGIRVATETCQKMLDNGIKSLHFYTMNLATAVKSVLQSLGKAPKSHERLLPWQTARISSTSSRKEEIRPIFWAYRQTSYLVRTADWDDFPNGRWGDSKSPAYGDLTDYYLAYKRPKVECKQLWGFPKTMEEVHSVFVAYIEGRIKALPWCENELSMESSDIMSNLKFINEHGFLTINSQPRVNGLPSSHPIYGWGGRDGYVFQKAYVEFFVSPENFKKLHEVLAQYPSLSYHAFNVKGDEFTNNFDKRVNAVTWGVFPGQEVIQPTVVDPASFAFWKDEAFGLWLHIWARAYSDDSELDSRLLIEHIHGNYFLVNIVDNDFANPESDIFAVFYKVIVENMDVEQLKYRVQSLETECDRLRETVQRLRALQIAGASDIQQLQMSLSSTRQENHLLKNELRDLQLQLALSGQP